MYSIRVWKGMNLPELSEDFKNRLTGLLKIAVSEVFEIDQKLVEVVFPSERIAIAPRSLHMEIVYHVVPFQDLNYGEVADTVNKMAQIARTMKGLPEGISSVSCQILPENDVFFSEEILNK